MSQLRNSSKKLRQPSSRRSVRSAHHFMVGFSV